MKAVVALGANLENPREAVELAIALLREATDVRKFPRCMKQNLWVVPYKITT